MNGLFSTQKIEDSLIDPLSNLVKIVVTLLVLKQ